MNFNNFNMEIEVPVEKNTISKQQSLGFGLGFEDSSSSKNPSSSRRDGAGGAAAGGNTLAIPNARPGTRSASNSSSATGTTTTTTAVVAGTGSGSGAVTAEEELSHKLPRMLKLAVVGESTAGKTCICERICDESKPFSEKYRLTCGVEVSGKTLKVDMRQKEGENNNETQWSAEGAPARLSGSKSGAGSGKGMRAGAGTRRGIDSASTTEKVNMVLLDSSGKDIYVELLPKYWGKLDGFVLVIDLTSKMALENAVPWLELAQAALQNASNANEKAKGDNNSSMSGLKTSVLIGNKADLKEQCVIPSHTAREFAKKYGLEYFECSVKENRGLQEAFQHIGRAGINQASEAAKRKLK